LRVLGQEQNLGQKVFNREHLCEGLDILKLTKTPLMYALVFHILVWGGLKLCLGD